MINPSTGSVVATVTVGPNPVDAAITPNGSTAYITNAGSDTVSVINTVTNSLATTVRVGWRPVDAAVTPGGSGVYVTNAGSDSVSVINTANNTVAATIPVGEEFPGHFRWTSLDHWRRAEPVHVVITPDGTRAYVTNDGASAYVADAGANSVTVIDTATNTVKTTLRVGAIPVDVSINPDGAMAYVANAGAKSISVIDTATNTVVATVRMEFIPVHVSISPRRRACLRDQCWFELRFSHRHRHQSSERDRAGWSSPGQ